MPILYRGKIIEVTEEEITLPDGRSFQLERIHHPGGAAIVALDSDNRVCLLHQYRDLTGGWLWELPAGKLEPNEPALETARRELEEEAGYTAAQWQELGTLYTSPGIFTEVIHLYLAQNLDKGAIDHQHDEQIEVHWMPLSEALEQAASGSFTDAKTTVGLLRAANRLGLLSGSSPRQ